MQALVRSFTLLGIEAIPVQVEVSIDDGYPVIAIVGLPGKAVRESLERIQAAFHGAGFKRPDKRVTVNLAPAELRKDGAFLDLAIALGILAALEAVPIAALQGKSVAGELSLTGEVRPVRGVLAMALAASRVPGTELLVPQANVAEARAVPGLRVHALSTLAETVQRLRGTGWEDDPEAPAEVRACAGSPPIPAGDDGPDLADIRGQAGPRRALEIAAAGGHNLLLFGPPGAGKTLLAQRLPGILPALTRAESLEASLVHSVAGLLPPGTGLLHRRPFRAPHHTISGPGLVGGGAIPRPGEASLAHGGVLFLDEMPEFRSPVLNLLRQPLEDGAVCIVRSGCAIRYPCRSMLVGAMNSWTSVAYLQRFRTRRKGGRRGGLRCPPVR